MTLTFGGGHERRFADLRFAQFGVPSDVSDTLSDRLAAMRKAVHWMFAALGFEHGDRIAVQRDASPRAILGPIEPSRSMSQIDSVPFQPGDLLSPAARR